MEMGGGGDGGGGGPQAGTPAVSSSPSQLSLAWALSRDGRLAKSKDGTARSRLRLALGPPSSASPPSSPSLPASAASAASRPMSLASMDEVHRSLAKVIFTDGAGEGGEGGDAAFRGIYDSPCCACVLAERAAAGRSVTSASSTCCGGDRTILDTCFSAVELQSPCVDPFVAASATATATAAATSGNSSSSSASPASFMAAAATTVAAAAGGGHIVPAVQAIRRRLTPFVMDASCGTHVHVSAGLGPRVGTVGAVQQVAPHVNPVTLLRLLVLAARSEAPLLHLDGGAATLASLGAMCKSVTTGLTGSSAESSGGGGGGGEIPLVLEPLWLARAPQREQEAAPVEGDGAAKLAAAPIAIGLPLTRVTAPALEPDLFRRQRAAICGSFWATLSRLYSQHSQQHSGQAPTNAAAPPPQKTTQQLDPKDALRQVAALDDLVVKAKSELGEAFIRYHRLPPRPVKVAAAAAATAIPGSSELIQFLSEVKQQQQQQQQAKGTTIIPDPAQAGRVVQLDHPSFRWSSVTGDGAVDARSAECSHCYRLHRQARSVAPAAAAMLQEAVAAAPAPAPFIAGGLASFFARLRRETDDPDAPDYFSWQADGTWSELNCHLSVNLCPLGKLGTIEFRSHAGTLDGPTIQSWAAHVSGLVRAAFQPSSGGGVAGSAKRWVLRVGSDAIVWPLSEADSVANKPCDTCLGIVVNMTVAAPARNSH